MYPDYGNALFWDEEGCCNGGYGSLFIGETEIILSGIEGLKEWYYDWENESLYQTHHWNDTQWKEWWAHIGSFPIAVSMKLSYDDI